jgi:hypothetical protein
VGFDKNIELKGELQWELRHITHIHLPEET